MCPSKHDVNNRAKMCPSKQLVNNLTWTNYTDYVGKLELVSTHCPHDIVLTK